MLEVLICSVQGVLRDNALFWPVKTTVVQTDFARV